MTIKIGLIRHGETDWNKARKMQGQKDIPLNEAGLKQAEAIAKRLRNENWDAIYSSDLLRAKRTAEKIAQAMGKTIQATDVRLRERSFGQYEGLSFDQRSRLQYPSGSLKAEKLYGIESNETLIKRALSFLEDLKRREPDRNVLLISHGGWIRAVLRSLCSNENLPRIGNTSISVLKFSGETWELELCNCMSHLTEPT